MSVFLFVERELLGAMRGRGATLLSLALLSLILFLGCFAALFLLPAGSPEVVARVSPRLTPESVNNLYQRLQERPDVQSVRYSLPEQVTSDRTGGTFTLVARPAEAADELLEALRTMDGVTAVERTAAANGGIVVSQGVRLGLLCGLVVCALAALVLAREGLRALLYGFRGEIRLMRLSGVPERQIVGAVVTAGLLVGLLAGILLAVGLVLYGLATVGEPGSGAHETTRLVGVGVVSLLLGLLMGGLMGLLGVGHLGSSRFSPIS